MERDDTQSVLDLLCSDIQLFDAEQRVADYVLSHASEASGLTLSKLAEESGASEATVSRFCKRLGFKSYRAFQLSLARDVSRQSVPGLTSSEVRLDDIELSLNNILEVKQSEISGTIRGLDHDELGAVVSLLSKARIVEIAAVGNTIPVAMDAAFKFNQLGIRSVTTEIFEKSAAFSLTLDEQDVLLLISNSGRSQRLRTLAEAARQMGTRVVLITGRRQSPLTELADHILLTVNREKVLDTGRLPFSRTSALVVIEVLYHLLFSCMPNAAPTVLWHKTISGGDKSAD